MFLSSLLSVGTQSRDKQERKVNNKSSNIKIATTLFIMPIEASSKVGSIRTLAPIRAQITNKSNTG